MKNLTNWIRNDGEGFAMMLVGIVFIPVVGFIMIAMIFYSSKYLNDSFNEAWATDAMKMEMVNAEADFVLTGGNQEMEKHRVQNVGQVGSLRHIKSGVYDGDPYELYSRLLDVNGNVDLMLQYEGSSDRFEEKDGKVLLYSSDLDEEGNWQWK